MTNSVNKSNLTDIFSYIEENRKRFVEDLQILCRQPSISNQNKGMKECACGLEKTMDVLGIETQVITMKGSHPLVYGHLKSKSSKTLLFYNHYDVQPPEPMNKWIYDPFSAEIVEGKIYARGVADNKGNLMARLKAVEAITEVFGEAPVNVKFLFEGEEEIGSPHLCVFLEEYGEMLNADGGLGEGSGKDAKGRPIIFLGHKGILYIELKAVYARNDQHSKWAPILENPAWDLTWALCSLKDKGNIVRIEGFYDDVKDPTKEELELLERISDQDDDYKRILGTKRFSKDLAGLDLAKALFFEPTCTICGLSSGHIGSGSKTVLPGEASAKLEFRLVADQHPEDILEKVGRHLKKHGFNNIELSHVHYSPPAKTDMQSDIARAIIRTVKDIYEVDPAIYPSAAGSGPMYLFTNVLKIPMASGGGVSYQGSNTHGPNENILVSDYISGIKHMAAVIVDFGTLKEKDDGQ